MVNHPNRSKKSELKDSASEHILSYKGFDKDFSCRGFKFEVGGTYIHEGDVKACESGFHACEHPLDIFSYYAPGESRYARVTQSGTISRHDGDTKIASGRITIEAELKLPEIISAAIKWVFDRAKWKDGQTASAEGEGCSISGTRGAASATGDRGAASATGYRGRAMGKDGCALFLVYHAEYRGPIIHVWAGIVGKNGIKPEVWYQLDETGQPVEVA